MDLSNWKILSPPSMRLCSVSSSRLDTPSTLQGDDRMVQVNAAKSGSFKVGGDIKIHRLGFGAMRVTGPGIWGPPADRAEAIHTIKRVPELGINFIDTADSYGPDVSEQL